MSRPRLHRLLPAIPAAALAALAVASAPVPAAASWLQPHTRQEAVPIADVQRSLLVGKSWLVFDAEFSWKQSTSHFVDDRAFNLGFTEGRNFVKENNDAVWNYRRWQIGLAWGFTKNSDFWFRVPLLAPSVWNSRMVDADGNRQPIRSFGLGDVHAGVKFQWLRTLSPTSKFSNSLVTGLDIRFPTGNESPGSYIGGPANVATILTGTGTWGFDVEARFKQQLAVLAVELGLGYLWNPTGTVMYLLEDQEHQFNQHLDPGDVVHGNLGLTVQFWKNLALRGDVFVDYRTKSRWGSTVDSFPACKDCAEIPNSNGVWVDAQARLISDFNAHLGIDGFFRYSLGGRRNFLWPLEELSPSRGWTAGMNLAYRF
jgi:hypothetical protein